MGGAVQRVAGVGQAAVLADRGQQQPSWWRWRDSNSDPPPDMVPGGGCAGGLTCGSLAPVVTARVRCSPLPAGSACTHRVPAGSGPVADASGAPVLRDQGPIGRPGTARQMQALSGTVGTYPVWSLISSGGRCV